ncbi:BON domain-containing protein [Ktedonobacter racemifer]|uniref:Transport-associated protein n=1 Tax=Ktedonobacter racemifer DSM 44963 TaxID=485913 RepID=D6U7J2_KTERA|nr:BON domain-containing protein [Ktedonobacter racemifer]EFH79853.1 transport-associated protein [Ktedonobacter racemifer DSM 44963]
MAVSPRSDEEIQEDVLAELKWDPRVRINEIGVIVTDGIVTLTGWVDSLPQKIAAEEAASRVRGVKAIVNDIEVRLPGFAERTDIDLAKAVLDALKWEADIPTGKLEVKVDHGWVTLKGMVEHNYQRQSAEDAVKKIAGVKGVTNIITVKPQLVPTDLKQQIEKALVRNAEIDAQRITVEMQDGKVILRGTVRSYAEKLAAEDTAWLAPGVTEVENHIVVSPLP